MRKQNVGHDFERLLEPWDYDCFGMRTAWIEDTRCSRGLTESYLYFQRLSQLVHGYRLKQSLSLCKIRSAQTTQGGVWVQLYGGA